MVSSRLQTLQEMLLNEPYDSFLNYALALEYAKLNDLDKAVDLIEAILVRDKNYLGAYYQLGKFYEQREQKDNAIKTYQKGISVAQEQKNRKTLAELNEALLILED